MKNNMKLIVFNFLMVIVCMPVMVAAKMYNIQKYGDLSFFEYYTISWMNLWYFYLVVFILGCFISKLMEKIIDKIKNNKNLKKET